MKDYAGSIHVSLLPVGGYRHALEAGRIAVLSEFYLTRNGESCMVMGQLNSGWSIINHKRQHRTSGDGSGADLRILAARRDVGNPRDRAG